MLAESYFASTRYIDYHFEYFYLSSIQLEFHKSLSDNFLLTSICFIHRLHECSVLFEASADYRAVQHRQRGAQAGAELRTEEHMFSQWRMRGHRFRDVPSHLFSQAKVIVFSLSLI